MGSFFSLIARSCYFFFFSIILQALVTYDYYYYVFLLLYFLHSSFKSLKKIFFTFSLFFSSTISKNLNSVQCERVTRAQELTVDNIEHMVIIQHISVLPGIRERIAFLTNSSRILAESSFLKWICGILLEQSVTAT